MYINIFIYIDLLYILTPVSFLLKGPETTSLRSIYLPLELTVSSMCDFLLCNFANTSCIANISCIFLWDISLHFALVGCVIELILN